MNVSRRDILLRALACRCPNCGRHGLLASWFRLRPACSGCGMDLSKSDGYYTGTTSIGYVASILAGVALGILGSFAFVVLTYPAMLCWMVAAYHVALPGELPANRPR
jgi:uncharacterized protein (DUF983 family)